MSSIFGSQQTGTATTTTNSGPPSWALPYISTAYNQANSLLSSPGAQYYPNNMVAGFSQPQQDAMQNIIGKANNTSGLDAATGYDQMLLNGGGSNPWLDKTFNQAATATQNRLASEFSGAGMDVANSAPLRGGELNNLANQIYGGNYQNTLANASNAANNVMGLYNTGIGGQQQALGVGQQIQNQAQNLINQDVNKFNYYQNLPYQQLQQYMAPITGINPGSTQTSSQPIYSNTLGNILGLGMTGLGIYNGGKEAGFWGG